MAPPQGSFAPSPHCDEGDIAVHQLGKVPLCDFVGASSKSNGRPNSLLSAGLGDKTGSLPADNIRLHEVTAALAGNEGSLVSFIQSARDAIIIVDEELRIVMFR